MTAGHLKEQDGYYYIILSYRDEFSGKRSTKTISTGLKLKGNKRRAEAMLSDARKSFTPPPPNSPQINADPADTLFSDFIRSWLRMMKSSIEATTYSAYSMSVEMRIAPYFDKTGLKLRDIKAKHIQGYYQYALDTEGVSPGTVLRRHANIRKALQYAYVTDIIPCNPADKVQLPRRLKYVASYYNESEIEALFSAFKGDPLETTVILTAFYGLRREEVAGLKWSAVDFADKTIIINHTISYIIADGKTKVYAKDRTKTKSSTRTLPLVEQVEQMLLDLRHKQDENRAFCGESYNEEFREYINVNQVGELYKPGYITNHFGAVLKKNGLRPIRFHDLRHSCASLLYKNGVSIKDIQAWLGHSDISTTMDIYTHLSNSAKVSSANAIIGILPTA